MSSLTTVGKLRKSRLEDPTQCSGFSSAAKRVARSYYPSFGIITQARMAESALEAQGYEPTAVGMSAALPYVTTFTSINDQPDLARLSRLVRLRG